MLFQTCKTILKTFHTALSHTLKVNALMNVNPVVIVSHSFA